MERTTSDRARRQAEEALLEPPLPHGGALPPGLLPRRPFAWLVASMGVSQLGFWGFFVAILGQAGYRFHAGPFQLGVLLSAFSLSFLLLTPVLAMATDRWSPKWMMVLGQVVAMAAVLPALFGSSLVWLYVASVIDGIGAAASIPARGSMTALLVEEHELVRANGMLNTASMLAVIVGPGASGWLLRHHGHSSAYLAILLAITAGTLLLLRLPDRRPSGDSPSSFAADLAMGFRVSWREPELRALLFLTGAAWFLITVLVTLEPLFVRRVLHRGVDGLGFLWSVHGVGAFAGAIAVTRARRAGGREVALLGGTLVVCGIGLAVYTGTSVFAVAIAGDAVFGAAFAWFLSLSQALIQRVAAEHLRGRVTGVVGMLDESSALVSSMGIAAVAGAIGSVQPYLVGSAVLLAAAGLWALRSGRAIAAVRAREGQTPVEPVDARRG